MAAPKKAGIHGVLAPQYTDAKMFELHNVTILGKNGNRRNLTDDECAKLHTAIEDFEEGVQRFNARKPVLDIQIELEKLAKLSEQLKEQITGVLHMMPLLSSTEKAFKKELKDRNISCTRLRKDLVLLSELPIADVLGKNRAETLRPCKIAFIRAALQIWKAEHGKVSRTKSKKGVSSNQTALFLEELIKAVAAKSASADSVLPKTVSAIEKIIGEANPA